VKLQHPLAVVCDDSEAPQFIYVADSYNHKVCVTHSFHNIIPVYQVKQVDVVSKHCSTLAGVGKAFLKDGDFSEAGFSEPGGVCLSGNQLYVADTNNHCVRIMDLHNRTVRQVVNLLWPLYSLAMVT